MKKVKNLQSLACPVTNAGPLSLFLQHISKWRCPGCNGLLSFWGGTVSDNVEKGQVLWGTVDWSSGCLKNVYPGIRTEAAWQSLNQRMKLGKDEGYLSIFQNESLHYYQR